MSRQCWLSPDCRYWKYYDFDQVKVVFAHKHVDNVRLIPKRAWLSLLHQIMNINRIGFAQAVFSVTDLHI